jgi:hypothetical protein
MLLKEDIKKFQISSLTVNYYELRPNKLLVGKRTIHFDLQGNEIIKSIFLPDGTRWKTKILVYSKKESRIFIIVINERGLIESQTEVEYSKGRRKCKRLIYYGIKNHHDTQIFKYNNNLDLTNYCCLPDNKINLKIRNKYNISNKLIEKRVYEAGKLFDHKELYEYDSAGNVKEIKSLGIKDILTSRIKMKYDKMGKITDEIKLNLKGEVQEKTKYVYKDNGLLRSEAKFGGDQKIKSINEYEYFK